jgi:hypothetical protein
MTTTTTPRVQAMPATEGFAIGDCVYLRGCPHGEPGRVLRIERGKLVVLWADLGPTYIGSHRPASPMLAEAV